MSDVEVRKDVPEGAKAVTARDVISQAVPERYEDVEYWMLKTPAGMTEVVRIRPEIGEKAEYHRSPLDGSVLGIKFDFHGGDKNEKTGERYVPMASLFFADRAFAKDPVYKNGESPAEIELKRRERIRLDDIAKRAAQLDEHLDED